MASVTAERIAAVQADISDAVTRTSEHSTLTDQEQDRLLAQCCTEACDLLKDWLDDPWWDRARPSSDGSIGEFVPAQKEFAEFLGPMLKDSLAQAGKRGVNVPDSLVDEAREKVAATARRFPRMRRQQLFQEARTRVTSLQREVCELAGQMGGSLHTAARRRKARHVLGKVSEVLLAVVLAMAGAGPHAAVQNATEWGQATVHAVEVITVHYLADRAQPNLRVAPSHTGPRLR